MNNPQYMMGLAGCGNMGEAILKGIIGSGFLNPDKIIYYDKKTARNKYIENEYKVFFAGKIGNLVKNSKYILIAVKPQDIPGVLEKVKKDFNPGYNKIISIAAGVSTDLFEKYLGNKPSVIRIMPNTPALINKGMAAISRGSFVSDDDLDFAVGIIRAVGEYVILDEGLQNTVTAISGSGPAYFFLFCKYLIESAVSRGIDKRIAEKLVIKTLAGAAEMLDKINPDTDYLINMVASPGGTTECAISQFNAMNIKNIIDAAVNSAERRADDIQGALEKEYGL